MTEATLSSILQKSQHVSANTHAHTSTRACRPLAVRTHIQPAAQRPSRKITNNPNFTAEKISRCIKLPGPNRPAARQSLQICPSLPEPTLRLLQDVNAEAGATGETTQQSRNAHYRSVPESSLGWGIGGLEKLWSDMWIRGLSDY